MKKDRSSSVLIFESIIAIAAGIVMTFFPESSFGLFVSLIGVWLIVTSLVQIIFIYRARQVLARKNLFIISSLLLLVLGILLFANPYSWGVFLVKLLGIAAVVLGILLVWFSVILRSVRVKKTLVGNTAPEGESIKPT